MNYSKSLNVVFGLVLLFLVVAQVREFQFHSGKKEEASQSSSTTASLAASEGEHTAPAALHTEMKIGVVDMNRIFTEYDKTKKVQAEYQVLERNANKELEERKEALKKQTEIISKLAAEIDKGDLSAEAREAKKKEYEEVLAKAEAMDREAVEFKADRERKFEDQFREARKNIIDEIMKVVDEQTKIRGFDLVFDKSGLSAGAVPVVLYTRPDFDISSDVIAILNKKSAAK